jgi:Ca2+-binding RTX toxin-like protein
MGVMATFKGTSGNDWMSGTTGDDTFDGGSGNDHIEGGRGNDTMIGGPGRDVFYFNRGDGLDQIELFDPSSDTIVFNGFHLVKSYGDLSPFIDYHQYSSTLNIDEAEDLSEGTQWINVVGQGTGDTPGSSNILFNSPFPQFREGVRVPFLEVLGPKVTIPSDGEILGVTGSSTDTGWMFD